jgi:acetyl-CoA carboxylase carboxyltransferase component
VTGERRARWEAKLRRLGQRSFQGRLEALADPGSLVLLSASDWNAAWEAAWVAVQATVHGRPVYAYATNFLVAEGTFGAVEANGIAALYDQAAAEGVPIVALLHSNGARVSEHHAALAANAGMFRAITRASGQAPQLAVCCGLALGVAAYVAALADSCWMVAGTSWTATTSPAVVRVATGQTPSLEELGGAAMHAGTSGVAHFLAPDETAALDGVRTQLGLLAGPVAARPPSGGDPSAAVPTDPRATYDVRGLIAAIVDAETFLESHARWARSLVTGFARLDGQPVGIVANQPRVRSGVLDTDACRKAARFVQTCDAWGLPLVYLVDVPGIMVAAHEERRGLLDAGATLFHAVDTAVPRVALVVRKCFGGAFVMLQARQAGGDRVLAWPGAHIGISGPEAAFAILHGKEAATRRDGDTFRADRLTELGAVPTDASTALAAGIVDAIVTPADTRAVLVDTLRGLSAQPPRQRVPRLRAVWPV